VVLAWPGLDIPDTRAEVTAISLKGMKVKKTQRGLALIAKLAQLEIIITPETLRSAVNTRYSGQMRDQALDLVDLLIS
jgi:hypothetical protein